MAGTQPVAVYALRIPPGDILVPAVPGAAAMFRLTMAAIDPSEEPEVEAVESKQKPRATLKVVRVPADMLDDDDSDEDDYDDLDDEEQDSDEEDSDGEGMNGGPSERRTKSKIAATEDDEAALAKLLAMSSKGKSKAADDEDDEDDEEDSDLDDLGMDECVLCTLDADKQYQQPLDFVVAEGEKVFFKVSGNLTVHLTGNYVMPIDEPSDDEEDEEDEYDLSPNEDELDGLDALLNGGDESDDLDDLEDPRVMEVDTDEEVQKKPKAAVTKGKNKRPAEDDDEDMSLDNIMAKAIQKDESAPVEQPKKLSKAEKKAAKKLKNNEGEAATPPQDSKKSTAQANGAAADSGKKVQFAKNLEQGPTPSKADAKAEKKSETKAEDTKKSTSLGVRDVSGVTVDDRKLGTGPAAKKGSKVELRYIGKLDNGKVFDANKSGKPFTVKVGTGEVIKGWDIGLVGITAGGERRLVIPAHLAYGKKALAGIPANSKLTFDIKCLAVK